MQTSRSVYRYDGEELRARPDSSRTRASGSSRGLAFAALMSGSTRSERVAQQVVHVDPRVLGVRTGGATPLQRPFAAVLGCADARVPVELIFHEVQRPVRRAGRGNVLGPDIVGSLR